MKEFLVLTRRYKVWVFIVAVLGIVANILALLVPKIAAHAIDASHALRDVTAYEAIHQLLIVAIITFVVTIIQIYLSTYFSEKVAFDIRSNLIQRLGQQTFTYVAQSTPGHLLTVITSDVDAVKNVIAQGLVTLLGAVVTLIGAAIFLLTINVRLALITLIVIPLLIASFAFIFKSLAVLFRRSQENIEKINALIQQTIVGAALIRVLNAFSFEVRSFEHINARSRDIGLDIVKKISLLIPLINVLSNTAILLIVWFGGQQVISNTLSLGELSAFIGYSASFVWPLFVLSFVGTMISRGGVSLIRINDVLKAPIEEHDGFYEGPIRGDIEFRNVTVRLTDASGTERTILKNISFHIKAGTRTALVGPTAAGKTQLLYVVAGLISPQEGEVLIDNRPLRDYKKSALLEQIGFVFQDSIIFNSTLRDNIALNGNTPDEAIRHAVRMAELDQLIASLPHGIDTMVSERGTSLSGGQKQRVMLARALVGQPRILLLDDFTARVDQATEAHIFKNITASYKDVTLFSITQKIEPIIDYDQIIVMMEGEILATGKHTELMQTSFEYKQMYTSQHYV